MKSGKPKLSYRFHDPNPPGAFAAYLAELLVEIDLPRAEAAIRAAAGVDPDRTSEALHEPEKQ